MAKFSASAMRKLCVNGVITVMDCWLFKKRTIGRSRVTTFTKEPFQLSQYSEDESLNLFRFTKFEIRVLLKYFKIPPVCRVRGHKFTGTEGLCILLRRLAYPNSLCELVKMFHRDASAISRIFNFMLKKIYFENKHRIKSLEQNWLTTDKLQEFSEKCGNAGSWYQNLAGFIDGTIRPICRPKYNQRDFYSGYKKQHVLKYQSVIFPNGLIGRLDGPFIGRRHDAAILGLSRLEQQMNTVFEKPNQRYVLYGDPGYSNSKFIKVGYKNHATLSFKQKEFNRDMSSLRVSVEYGFGKIIQQFAYLDFKKNQKVFLVQLKFQYFVAALLVNCQTCLRGNQVSTYFQCIPPTISEYLD